MKRVIDNVVQRVNGVVQRLEGRTITFYPSLIGPILFLVVGIVGFLLMPSQVKIQEGTATTARTFPSLMLSIIVVCSLVLLGREVVKLIRKEPVEVVQLDVMTEIRALIILALLTLYALLIPVLGFIVTSMIFGMAMLVFFKIKRWTYYLVVCLSALGIGLIFQVILNVRLP